MSRKRHAARLPAMPLFLLHHQHAPAECAAAFAAWPGFDSPLRGEAAASTCLQAVTPSGGGSRPRIAKARSRCCRPTSLCGPKRSRSVTSPSHDQPRNAETPVQPEAIDPTVYARRWKTLGVLAISLLIIGLDNT